eukprot:754582-Hanusia_phi.AAC.8
MYWLKPRQAPGRRWHSSYPASNCCEWQEEERRRRGGHKGHFAQRNGTGAIVLAPTRELALQTYAVCASHQSSTSLWPLPSFPAAVPLSPVLLPPFLSPEGRVGEGVDKRSRLHVKP